MESFHFIEAAKCTFLVDVVMLTYNQEQYISQAIESVLFQECNFSYRLIIANDCSTDNTYNICERYKNDHPDKIMLINNLQNIGLIRNYYNAFKKVKAKYIAILEGDDYWNIRHKLQVQVDYLQEHENVGLVHTNLDCLYEEKNTIIHDIRNKIPKGNVFYDLLHNNFITPATVMFRSHLLNHVCLEDYLMLDLKTLDYILWLDFAKHTQFEYIDLTTAVYRFSNKSVSHSNSYEKVREFLDSEFNTKNYICGKHGVDKGTIKKISAEYHYDCLWLAIRYNKIDVIRMIRKKFPIKNAHYLIIYFLANSYILRNMFLKFYNVKSNS